MCLAQIIIVALVFVPIMMLSYTDVLHARPEKLVSISYQVEEIFFFKLDI